MEVRLLDAVAWNWNVMPVASDVLGVVKLAELLLAPVSVTAGPDNWVQPTLLMVLPPEAPAVAVPVNVTSVPRATGSVLLALALVVGAVSAKTRALAVSASSMPAPHAVLPAQ